MDFDLGNLVLQVEDTFGFAVPYEDAAGLTTVGSLFDYVLAHRFHGKQDACLRSIAFYKVRRALMSALKIPRDAVWASTDLSAIIPKRRRRKWRAIQKTSGCRLPMLRRPRWVVMLASFAAVALGIAVPILLRLKPFRGGVAVAVFSTIAFAYTLCWLTECLAIAFPPDATTVGQLAKAVLARNYQPLVAESKNSAPDAKVWEILRCIVAEQLGVPPDQLTKETDLVRDLNAA